MSNIIKYRVWDSKRGVVVYPSNVAIYCGSGAFGWWDTSDNSGGHSNDTDQSVIERWTGLLDKDGCEIYEGDIIQRIWVFAANDNVYLYGDAPPGHYTEEPNMIGAVEYSAFEAQYTIVSYKGDKWTARTGFTHGKWSDARGTRYKVLGNIHQNRELLS